MKRLALLLLLGAAQPVAAQPASPDCASVPAVLPFEPPAHPLRFTVETERMLRDGGAATFKLAYRVQFHSIGRGYGMTATLVSVNAPVAMPAGQAMEAILSPLVGLPVSFLVDVERGVLTVRESDALWQMLASGMIPRAQSAQPDEARQLARSLLALPVQEREALLAADLRHMLRFAGQQPEADFNPSRDRATNCNLLQLEKQSFSTDDAMTISFHTRWLVDASTGLVSEQSEEQWRRSFADAWTVLDGTITRRLAPE